MDNVKLEKRLRLVPFVCFIFIFFARKFIGEEYSLLAVIGTIVLALISIASFVYIGYLEKKDGRFNPKKYYLFYFFIIISIVIFLFSWFQADTL